MLHRPSRIRSCQRGKQVEPRISSRRFNSLGSLLHPRPPRNLHQHPPAHALIPPLSRTSARGSPPASERLPRSQRDNTAHSARHRCGLSPARRSIITASAAALCACAAAARFLFVSIHSIRCIVCVPCTFRLLISAPLVSPSHFSRSFCFLTRNNTFSISPSFPDLDCLGPSRIHTIIILS